MKLHEVTTYNLKSQTILNEGWNVLTEAQQLHIGQWEKRVWPLYEEFNRLMEAELTANQVQDIFTNAEKVAIEGGDNLTALGKAGKVTAEVSGKMKAELDKLIKQAAESGPVKNFDQQFEKLKAQLKTKLQGNPAGQKILQGVEKWGGFAKENPAKSAFIIGAMTSVLAFASGGILSGAAIGFFLKLANNTIKGDKLSVAMAKGVKGAALGAVAGALGSAISSAAEDLFPAEVTNIFVNQDGAIDISQIDAMDATSLTDIDADAAKELIQARSAMEEMLPRLSGEEGEVLQQQLDQLNDKIVQLGGGENLKGSIDAIQSEFGIEGRGVDVVVKGNDVDTGTDAEPLPGDDGDYGEPADDGAPDADKLSGDEVGTVKAEYSAEELNDKFNIDSSEFPRNGWLDENKDALLKAGMTETEFEDLQAATQLERAVDQANFREGISMSSSSELKTFMGDEPKVIGGIEGEYEAGETFTNKIETKLPGSDKPWSANVTTQIEGVDADGNTVYAIKELTVGPEVFNDKMFAAIDKLAEQDPDNPLVKAFMDNVILANKEASMETLKDTFAQDVAEKVMQGAAAVALGGALAASEVKPAETKESRDLRIAKELEEEYKIYLEVESKYTDEYLAEIGIKDIAKKAAAGAANIGKAAAKGVGAGMDKAGAAVGGGIGRAVGAVAGAAKSAGKELGNKITVKKLNAIWKKMGEPLDTGSIANILSDAGMSDEAIGLVATNTKTDLKPTPKADADADAGATDAGATDAGAPEGGTTDAGTPAQGGKPEKGAKATGSDGDTYTFQGQQWTSDKTGRVATKAVAAELNKGSGTAKASTSAQGGDTPAQAQGGGTQAQGDTQAQGGTVDVKALAQEIKKAGVADAVKQSLAQPAGQSASAGQLGNMEIDIPTLADEIGKAGLQKQVRDMLTQKQPA